LGIDEDSRAAGKIHARLSLGAETSVYDSGTFRQGEVMQVHLVEALQF
jgi:hypothetical protein